MTVPSWAGIANELTPYTTGWFNPRRYGAAWNGSNDTTFCQAAIDDAIDYATAGGTIAKTASTGPIATVYFPPGRTYVNGLICDCARVRFFSPGCEIRSYAAQTGSIQYLLTVAGGYNEALHIGHGGFHGITFNGNNHAYVGGLKLLGVSHYHLYQTAYRNFQGTGAGIGLMLDEVWDSCWWGGFMNGCGLDGGSLAASTSATQIWASDVDNSNQLYFYGFTFESNKGNDVGIYATAGNPKQCNGISFIGCKWEQSGTVTNYAGVYVPQSITGMLTFEGKCYVAGYDTNGNWLNVKAGANCKVLVSDSTEFGNKSITATGGTLGATIYVQGTGMVRPGGRITTTRLTDQPLFLDSSAMTGANPVRWGNVMLDDDAKSGFGWKGRSSVTATVLTEAGRVRYPFKLAPGAVANFRPADDTMIVDLTTNDKTDMCGTVAIRAENGGTAECVLQSNSTNIEVGTGSLTAGTGTNTAGKLHVRVNGTDGRVYLKNRHATDTVYVYAEPRNRTDSGW